MDIQDDVLSTADLLLGLNEEEAAALISLGKRRTYRKGDQIMKAGERGRELCIVLRGQVEVLEETASGESTLVILGAGQSVGEMAILDAGPRSATVRCVTEEATLLCIPGDALLDFCGRTCSVGYRLMYNLARDLAFKLRHRNLPRTARAEVSP
ncbi:MAG: cyclic nucleotide-binding domain-containing protein [Anaerolineae bacterium]